MYALWEMHHVTEWLRFTSTFAFLHGKRQLLIPPRSAGACGQVKAAVHVNLSEI